MILQTKKNDTIKFENDGYSLTNLGRARNPTWTVKWMERRKS